MEIDTGYMILGINTHTYTHTPQFKFKITVESAVYLAYLEVGSFRRALTWAGSSAFPFVVVKGRHKKPPYLESSADAL